MKTLIKSIAIITLVSCLFSCKEKMSGSELFNSQYKSEQKLSLKYLEMLSTKGFADDGSGRKDTLAQGINLYRKGKYMESKRLLHAYLEQYESPGSDHDKATFFLGLCEIENGKYDRAIAKFEELKSSQEFEIADESAYFTALCYLKVNEKKAIKLFEEIAGNNNSNFHDEATALLGML